MILTYKIKHNRNFSIELNKAIKIANFAIKNRTLSSKNVKHFGLKSIISNQILKKYSRNRKCKTINSVKLTIPNQGISVNKELRTIRIICLNLIINYKFNNNFIKINQIEIDKKYCYVSCLFENNKEIKTNNYLGIDLNTTSHCAVIANKKTGKVIKLGKQANHIHLKYKNIRKKLQKKGTNYQLKQIKNREQNIIKDLNHKISRKIVNLAKENNCGIKLENLINIRENRNNKTQHSFKYSLNSWSFYQLKQMIEYKSKILGIPVIYIDPHYTSQRCSRCGLIGNRNDKGFRCDSCGHVDHADSNAAFNIAKGMDISIPATAFELTNQNKDNECDDQSILDRDNIERNPDILRIENQMLNVSKTFVN
jgi:putative transposase